MRSRVGYRAVAGAAATCVALLVVAGSAEASTPACAGGTVLTATTFTLTCSYDGTTGADGSAQSFTVPSGISQLTVTAFGAAGGATYFGNVTGVGGLGGQATALLKVTTGDALTIDVAGQGGTGEATAGTPAGAGSGGFAGGGSGGNGDLGFPGGGGGGGGSSVSDGSSTVLVAGGGGGGCDQGTYDGGSGGGLVGGNGGGASGQLGDGGSTSSPPGGGAGSSGGASAGGAGHGGAGGDQGAALPGGGGGGGGYYGGGGGGAPSNGCAAGGGGSGFIGQAFRAVTSYTPATTCAVPNLVHPDCQQNGVRSGSGLVTISYALRTTATAVSCIPNPVDLGHSMQCTATVTDTASGSGPAPAGSVSFETNGTGSFPASSCPLPASGSVNCSVTYTPSALGSGSQEITATYAPTDDLHSASIGTAPFSVTENKPALSAAPTISGIGKADSTLTCSAGTWLNSPTGYSYQWELDGTPIAGATSSTYRVQKIDEGGKLTCTVTASNLGGSDQATSNQFLVPVPYVRHCPAATGSVHGATLGLIHLGMNGDQARHVYAHSSTRGFKYKDFFCLTPYGVRVGYASSTLLSEIPHAERKPLTGRVVWISTDNARYADNGIRAGATLAAAQRALPHGYYFRVGLNYWYLAPMSRATAVLKLRHGLVEEIGIADKQLTRTDKADRELMTSFE